MSLQTPSPPTDVNCPRDVSRKKRGIPANTRVMKYGMRKAPACADQHGDGSSKHVWKTVIYIIINRFSHEEMGGIVLNVADVSINSHELVSTIKNNDTPPSLAYHGFINPLQNCMSETSKKMLSHRCDSEKVTCNILNV